MNLYYPTHQYFTAPIHDSAGYPENLFLDPCAFAKLHNTSYVLLHDLDCDVEM
jgi:hypothetical protein